MPACRARLILTLSTCRSSRAVPRRMTSSMDDGPDDLSPLGHHPWRRNAARSPVPACKYASGQHPRQARWSAAKRSGSNGGLGLLVRLPIPGKQLGDLVGGMIWKRGQHVSEPGLRIDVVHLAGFDQGIDGGGTMAAGIRAGEGPILSSDRHTTQRSFGGVVRKADAAVVEEAGERCPAVEAGS